MRRALVTSCLMVLAACSGKGSAEKGIAEKAKLAAAAAAEREKAAAVRQAAREAAMSNKPPPTPAGEVVKVAAPYGDEGNTVIHSAYGF